MTNRELIQLLLEHDMDAKVCIEAKITDNDKKWDYIEKETKEVNMYHNEICIYCE